MPARGKTTGTPTWWDRRDGKWVVAGSAPARFGAKSPAEGRKRRQGTDTTPTGPYDLPYGFGIKAAPSGTSAPYHGYAAPRSAAEIPDEGAMSWS
ncbi:hypothetical protein [Streptomyces noursei]|uniref:hypothetical protein n=1 Tax=Streptomyces noursei TaxID=1971 RepID=UPI003570E452